MMFLSFCQFLRPLDISSSFIFRTYQQQQYSSQSLKSIMGHLIAIDCRPWHILSLLLTIIKMSYISSPNKNSSLWKASGSKGNHIEHSRLFPSYRLPEKFSPSRGGLNDSRLFNSSIEKLKLSKIHAPNETILTPKRQSAAFVSFASQQQLKGSAQMPRSATPNSKNNVKTEPQSKGPNVCISEQQMEIVRMQVRKSLVHEYEHNRRLIMELKEEFSRFRESVLGQVSNQQRKMMEFVREITKRIELDSHMIETLNKEVEIRPAEINASLKQNQIKLEKLVNILIQQEQSPKPSKPNVKEDNALPSPQKINSPTSHKKDSLQQRKDSPNMQKCTQLVETINILSQINDCPVESPKSLEKRPPEQKGATEECKQKGIMEQCREKALNSIKSNDSLWRQKWKTREADREQAKLKGNFKLDKFYSAIEKLKQQVNEIRHISQIKQTKNGRIIKTYQ